MAKINEVAERTKQLNKEKPKAVRVSTVNAELNEMSKAVQEYFKDSKAILIRTKDQLHDYVTRCIEAGYAGIDTETTGLDRQNDWIVGVSLYYPGGVECYIPMKHLVPIFESPYKGQLSYEEVSEEFKRMENSNIRLIFANADYDLAMIYKDLKVDFCDRFYYDVILAWRCLKENELHNDLKFLYNKYVLKGKGDPKRFSDFFSVKLFPFSDPEIAKLYAANDAKITYDLFKWQLPYVTESHPKCQKSNLQAISRLIWDLEMPMVKVCQNMHRTGMYIDKNVANALKKRYREAYNKEMKKLQDMVQEIIDNSTVSYSGKRPFTRGVDFNPSSPPQVKYLVYDLLQVPKGNSSGTGKEVLNEINLPVTNQILKVRSLSVLINTFVDKLPNSVARDGRIHGQFKQIGADTGRMSSAEPNLQNIPSHAVDIRHMFRATPGYVMLGSDFSQQEPKLTAFVGDIKEMCEGFAHGKDAYALIASVSFNMPYEKCLEFHPDTHEYQPDGKARRSEAKSILLGVLYGRSIPSIADQLYGKRDDMTDEQKQKAAQKVFDAVMNAFPGLRNLMINTQNHASQYGYTETILGRRRHLPDMQLPEFEFKAMKGYVNPDVDPLDINTLENRDEIPKHVVDDLKKEFGKYKYYGQIAKRTKQLYEEEHIRVINNRPKINDSTRQCVNCVDDETEILTVNGWKHERDVSVGDSVIGYDVNSKKVVVTDVTHKHVYSDENGIHVYEFNSPTFNSVSTEDHRWVVCQSDEDPRFKTSQNIWKNKWPDYPILRVDDNDLPGNSLSDDYLKLLGWIMTDGYFSKQYYGIEIYQSTRREKNALIYHNMIETLNNLGFSFNDKSDDGIYHTIYINKNDILYDLWKYNPDRTLSFDFVSTLSQHQAEVLMWAMIEGDGTLGDNGKFSNITFTCNSVERKDVFQYLAFIAGYATNAYRISAEDANRWTNGKLYPSLSNKTPVVVKNDYWTISVLRVKRAHIYPHHKSERFVNKVWCVTTGTGTWVMRRNGKVSITGNSVVQGSAADLTKMAILNLCNNKRWQEIGGRLLVPVHDELITEVPEQYAEEGAKILSDCMCGAASFMPFPITCDVETSYRWYGMEYPCPYHKPESLTDHNSDEIKWIQYHLVEMEYKLPVYKDKNGEKPRGDAAKGVNGVESPEMKDAIEDYIKSRHISSEEFIDYIEKEVSGRL
jgi:DNA polymerase-1